MLHVKQSDQIVLIVHADVAQAALDKGLAAHAENRANAVLVLKG
jgi:hypothetical protein